MTRRSSVRSTSVAAAFAALAMLVLMVGRAQPLDAQAPGPADGFNDSHFHLTNYVQQGIDVRQFLAIMGTRVGRSTLFGIPLQQQWSYGNSGDFAPTYYLQTDAPLYYYSFTDAFIATAYRALPTDQQARFDPMITGFNPADMYGVEHIRRVLETFPGVFSGIGEFTIHKEFVSAKISGETASLTNPALDRILSFAEDTGLVVLIHSDIDVPFSKHDAKPVYLEQMTALLARHPKAAIIWAHTGLGRVVSPTAGTAGITARAPSHLAILESLLSNPALRHVSFDLSWDEVAKYVVTTPASISRTAELLNKYPDRFLFGTDTVAPDGPGAYYAVFDMWAPVWRVLTPSASLAIRKGNYERIFDEGRRRVRNWESTHGS